MANAITTQQIMILLIIFIVLLLFIWDRWRYDFVALTALATCGVLGLLPPSAMFSGFGHPAVITVAVVLIISQAATNAGVVDVVARLLSKAGNNLILQQFLLTSLVAFCSGFMNNVGALALMMPVAVWLSRRSDRHPGLLLMPVAFGSLLGGMLTLIGTPPNIIISGYLRDHTGSGFAMFSFLPVGLAVNIVGIIFIALIGWRLIPLRGSNQQTADLFSIEAYMTEIVIPENNQFDGKTLHDLMEASESKADINVIALLRGERRITLPSTFEVLHSGDILMIEISSYRLHNLLEVSGMKLAEEVTSEKQENTTKTKLKRDDLKLSEVVVSPMSLLVGTTLSRLAVRERYGMNVLAVARQGQRLRRRVSRINFMPGDILLVQSKGEEFAKTLRMLGCLPLAARTLNFGRQKKVLQATLLFVAAIALVTFNILPASLALLIAALTMMAIGIIEPTEFYKGIDFPVIVLLAAMIPVGGVLETSGAASLLANGILTLTKELPAYGILIILMATVIVITNVINNAAAAILAAPIALEIATAMNYSPKTLLMAVAVASSSAFLTPIGHQSNTLVMSPGGYHFGDYWRMGLPLSILVIAVSVPMILWCFPINN